MKSNKNKKQVIKNAAIRFDGKQNSWAVCDAEGNALQHFTHGYIKNATFSRTHSTEHICGVKQTVFVGLAHGELHVEVYSSKLKSLENIQFDGMQGLFLDVNYKPLTKVKLIQLMPDRRALMLQK